MSSEFISPEVFGQDLIPLPEDILQKLHYFISYRIPILYETEFIPEVLFRSDAQEGLTGVMDMLQEISYTYRLFVLTLFFQIRDSVQLSKARDPALRSDGFPKSYPHPAV